MQSHKELTNIARHKESPPPSRQSGIFEFRADSAPMPLPGAKTWAGRFRPPWAGCYHTFVCGDWPQARRVGYERAFSCTDVHKFHEVSLGGDR